MVQFIDAPNFSRGRATRIREPDWAKLRQASTEEERILAWRECEHFVHGVITPKEYIHSCRKWIRDFTDWNVYPAILRIPEPFFATIAKDGWKAYVLGYMPESAKNHMKKEVFSLLERAEELQRKMYVEPTIHPSISLNEDNELHPDRVKEWIDVWKKWMQANRTNKSSTQYQTASRYVQNMQTYLTTGVWLDTHCGEKRDKKIFKHCIAMAYDKDGLAKRTVDVYYSDLGCVWTKEMRDDYARVHRKIS